MMLAPIVLVTLVSVLAYGGLRARHAAEISLVALAGVGASHALSSSRVGSVAKRRA